MSRGHHNQNFMLPLTERMAQELGRDPGTCVTVRIRLTDALPVVIRTWHDEESILAAIKGVLPHVPVCLARGGDSAVLSYVEGVPLSTIAPNGKPVDPSLVEAIAGLLAQMTQVRKNALPPVPDGWPRSDKDSQGFLRTLAYLADRQIRRPNEAAFGGLFAALGIPEDAMTRLAERVPAMARRPYSLLHTDLHRDNVIVSYHGDPPLICVDWELATYGDPLHDLATHLVRMRYPDFQWDEVTEAWASAMQHFRPAAVNGLARDLSRYVDFERAQSVYPDVMRAANSLRGALDQKRLDEATAAVRRALLDAARPLGLSDVPDVSAIERILFRWHAAHSGRSHAAETTAIGWEPDLRVPEHPEFPRSAVLEALVAEGAAPAQRVFKGTTHLNSVVRVTGIELPVVVRRRLNRGTRGERQFLNEHAVLQAIKRSGVPVRTPELLALGVSGRRDQFAIHTYVGSPDEEKPPNHPVNGLLPHEADDLVDQLCSLVDVPVEALDPAALGMDFYSWLRWELVSLVEELPKETKGLARVLGLPSGRLLDLVLARYWVRPRPLSLLHGDLNPWNLVRGEGDSGLVIIDWEKAMIGDSLYDLVRHMHLTPIRHEIQARMFQRWHQRLPHDYTRDWQVDRRVYRWIENVRSAYVDLDRLVTGEGLDAPNVQRAVDSYGLTLQAATASLGLPAKGTANPYLARALPYGDIRGRRTGGPQIGL